MGSGELVVMDEDSCMVDIAKFFLSFTEDEASVSVFPAEPGSRRCERF